ncbi:hypothetical protein KI387_018292, partial [Taxus chinensis]
MLECLQHRHYLATHRGHSAAWQRTHITALIMYTLKQYGDRESPADPLERVRRQMGLRHDDPPPFPQYRRDD